jgi:glucokinase
MLGNVMILAGDIGGTNTRLGLYGPDGQAAIERSFANRGFPTFDAALARFLDDAQRPAVSSAALAVAGPIFDGRVAMTNIGWTLEEKQLSHALGGARMRLLNDLQAAAYGIVQLPDDEFRMLAPGTPIRRATSRSSAPAPASGKPSSRGTATRRSPWRRRAAMPTSHRPMRRSSRCSNGSAARART